MAYSKPALAKLETMALTLLGIATLPLLMVVASKMDFGSDPAGDAMLAGAFVLFGTPTILILITLRLIFLGRSFKPQLAVLLPFAYVLTWLGGIPAVMVASAYDARGRIEYLSISNASDGRATELRIRGLGREYHMPQVGMGGRAGSSGSFGKLPVDLEIFWTDETGSPREQRLYIPSPEPLPSHIELELTLGADGKWTHAFDDHK